MLVNIKKADSIWATTPMFQALDSKMEDWTANFEDFFYGKLSLFPDMPAERKHAVHAKYIERARQDDFNTDALAIALTKRCVIAGRKTLHSHKGEQLAGGNVSSVDQKTQDCLSHMPGHNDACEAAHGHNNWALDASHKRGIRNCEGMVLSRSNNLTGAIASGEITHAELELAEKLTNEWSAKHGSQTQEEAAINEKYRDVEDKRRNDRRKTAERKLQLEEEAEALDLIYEPEAIDKLTGPFLVCQLRAWRLWAEKKKKTPGDKLEYTQKGKVGEKRDKLKAIIAAHGIEAEACQRTAHSGASMKEVVIASTTSREGQVINVSELDSDDMEEMLKGRGMHNERYEDDGFSSTQISAIKKLNKHASMHLYYGS
jgi:hypothetical protein